MTSGLPSVFVSHGAPTLIIEDTPARRFLGALAGSIGRPSAVLVASAHWLTDEPTVSTATAPETIHDFRGFPEKLYAMTYEAPGAPGLADAAIDLLAAAGLPGRSSATRGLDHGAWVPLRLMYPDADIPVAQISIQPNAGPSHHLDVGRALRPLRDQGVLILGSGGFTHNLRAFFKNTLDSETPSWVERFATWTAEALLDGRTEDLIDYRRRAPSAAENHPTEEHFLPLFVALGAGSDIATPERLHASYTYGVLAMDAYAFA